MFALYLISLVLASKDFETLGNDYTNCSRGGEIVPFTYNYTKLFFAKTVDGCHMVDETDSIYEPAGSNWKTYPLPTDMSANFTISPDPLGSAGLADPTVKNDYTGAGFNTVGYIAQAVDMLYMTYSQHQGAYPTSKKVSLAGTLYGVHHIGRRVEDEQPQRRTITYFNQTLIDSDYTTENTEGYWMLYYAATREAGLIDTTCVADERTGLAVSDPATPADYKCTAAGKTTLTIDSQRFATGYNLVQVTNVPYATVKQLLAKYGPLLGTFWFSNGAFEANYFNVSERPRYYIPTGMVGDIHCLLIYGWATVPKRDDDPENATNVDVWKFKYVYSKTHTHPAPSSPFGMLKIMKGADNSLNTEDAAAVTYFVKDCTGLSCDTCSATGCVCGTSKCDKCPGGTDKTNCTCDSSMNCAVCTTPANTNCSCTALCSKCPEGSDKDHCEPDPPPPDDAAFGVKVTLLLALLAVFFAL